MTDLVRIGNCSGFYGDRLSAMREQLEGVSDGPNGRRSLDYITGDYLAELTMLILGTDTFKDPNLGYARTFVRQMEDCLGLALEKGVKIVTNAGGLNPAGLAEKLREVAKGLGLDPAIAHVEGDHLLDRVEELGLTGDRGKPLTANAYLGAYGIVAALDAGADVVVTGRVTDASVVVGPAAAHHGWDPTAHDELASAVVAGHIIECGTQATGGNFSGFLELPISTGSITDMAPLGFPVAEVAADGSFAVTKHEGTGGAVTVDTVTAQLVYEIQTNRYLNPDVTVDLTSIQLEQQAPDRVAVSGVRGEAPPKTLKVCLNDLAGFRNSAEFVLTGLDVDAKAEWLQAQIEATIGDDRPERLEWSPVGLSHADATTEEDASVLLRLSAFDPDEELVGKAFTGPVIELALASYPGFSVTRPPAKPMPYGVYRPAYVDRSAVTHTAVLPDGTRKVIADPATAEVQPDPREGQRPSPFPAPPDSLTRKLPLGTFVHARSGDKGGDANLGLWVKHDGSEKYDDRVTWLQKFISPRKVRELIPEAADLDVEVYLLPNLGGVNVLIHGLLDEGVAATSRFDPQAKGLGEWVRSRLVNIEERLI